ALMVAVYCCKARLDIRIRDASKHVAGIRRDLQRSQAMLGGTVLFDLSLDQTVEQMPVAGVECTAFDKQVGKQPMFVQAPGIHGGEQIVLTDQLILQSQHSEQQVEIGWTRRLVGIGAKGRKAWSCA